MERKPVRGRLTPKQKRFYFFCLKVQALMVVLAGAYVMGMLAEQNHHHVPQEIKVVEKIMTVTTTVDHYIPPSKDLVIEEIITQAKAHGVSVYKAIEISRCESRFNAFAQAQKSSARGVFQFIDKTWDNYCEGNRDDYRDNIACFMKLYPKHPEWWECKV